MFTLILALSVAVNGEPARADMPAGSAVPVVEVEEDVYGYEPPNNGAGPMWCHGSTCLVRIGDDVFASGIETLPDAKPLNNCRWTLFKRTAAGWQLQHVDQTHRTREPCPMVGFPDGRLLLSTNPTLVADPTAYNGPAQPEILQFSAADPKTGFQTLLPGWHGTPAFTEHSYRSFAADVSSGEFLLFQQTAQDEWAFRDRGGRWAAGQLERPWGGEYPTPQSIRICYPNVALKNRAVHLCGVSDIVEPYPEWKAFKRQLTGNAWDYDFRRLFYTWSDDIASGKFHPWLELASRDKTCGWISPGDLWVDADGAAHIVWCERAIDERLREKFFPDAKQLHQINYATVRDGKVLTRRTLLEAHEGVSQVIPGRPRFQVTPDGRLFVFLYVSGADAAGKQVSENRVLELQDDGAVHASYRVPLAHPFNDYFTATVRAGSPASVVLDMLGTSPDVPQTMRYARVRLW